MHNYNPFAIHVDTAENYFLWSAWSSWSHISHHHAQPWVLLPSVPPPPSPPSHCTRPLLSLYLTAPPPFYFTTHTHTHTHFVALTPYCFLLFPVIFQSVRVKTVIMCCVSHVSTRKIQERLRNTVTRVGYKHWEFARHRCGDESTIPWVMLRALCVLDLYSGIDQQLCESRADILGSPSVIVRTVSVVDGWLKCCFTSTETVGILGTGARTATSTFTQLLSPNVSLDVTQHWRRICTEPEENGPQ